jgi:hypothetical protein
MSHEITESADVDRAELFDEHLCVFSGDLDLRTE